MMTVMPYAIIIWSNEGVMVSKTICYDAIELQLALDRNHNPQDLYYRLTPSVHYTNTPEAIVS